MDGGAVLWARVRIGAGSDLVTVALAKESIEALCSRMRSMGPIPPSVSQLRYQIAVVAGIVELSVAQLSQIEPGDIVTFDEVAPGMEASGPGGGTEVDLAVVSSAGIRFVSRARLDSDRLYFTQGQSGILEGGMKLQDEQTAIDTTRCAAKPGDGMDLSRVADLPAGIVVEISRLTMSVGELISLAPGKVITLHRAPSAEVALTCGGREIASGVLVEVDGELGVQVLRLAGRIVE
jgi:type III secretion system YscQ/HrcQ family protein